MTTYRYATTDDLLRAIELVPVWTASLFKRWDDATTPRTDKPIRIGRLATCGLVITYRR